MGKENLGPAVPSDEDAGQRIGFRADDGIRTRDPHLGKVVLYQLSHVRVSQVYQGAYRPVDPNPPSPRSDPGSSETSTGST